MMDVSGINSSFLNTITDASSARQKADEVNFQEILKKTLVSEGEEKDEQLKEACEDFEAYYINKVFREMRRSIPKSDLVEQSQGREIFEDMLYDGYAKEMAKGTGTGLKEMLYKQLKND